MAPARVRKIPYLRSLRSRALLVALLSLGLPPAIVVGWLVAERGYERGMARNAELGAASARELLLALRSGGVAAADGCGRWGDLQSDAALRDLVRRHRIQLSLLDSEGRHCFEHDADDYVDWSQLAGSVVLGRTVATATAPRAPPPVERAVLNRTRAEGSSIGCEESHDTHAVRCQALLAIDDGGFLLAQDAAWRPASMLSELEGPLVRLSLLSAPFVLLLSWWMSRRLVRPIETLREQVLVKARSASDAPDLAAASGDEVDDLTRSFNTLLGTIEQRRASETAAAADLVHELKNPLAAIRACAEALQKPHVDAERRAELGGVIERSSGRLAALAAEYLELARAEARLPGEEREVVDLAALVRGVAGALEDDARFGPLRIEVSGDRSVRIDGVAQRLESVVFNLLENAASFTPRDGRIEIEIVAHADRVELRVLDSGPGIEAHELGRVFDRFFSRRSDGTGTGLGLALSRAIVEAHGGTLSAANRTGGGAIFVARFPRAESGSAPQAG